KIYANFMPNQPSSFQWDLNPGYHEIIDPPSEETLTARYIKEIEGYIKSKNNEKAKIVLENGLTENEFSIELVLIKATRFFESEKRSIELLENIEKIYPNDLRLLICKALIAKDSNSRLNNWKLVLAKFENGDPTYKDYFSAELVR